MTTSATTFFRLLSVLADYTFKLLVVVSFCSGKLVSPKWKNFKGLKLLWRDKIRLNNAIWRAWYMQCECPVDANPWHYNSQNPLHHLQVPTMPLPASYSWLAFHPLFMVGNVGGRSASQKYLFLYRSGIYNVRSFLRMSYFQSGRHVY